MTTPSPPIPYVVETRRRVGWRPERIAVAGESAGGNLALNVAIAARDQKLTEPVASLPSTRWPASDLNTQSYIDNQNAVPLGKADIEWFVGNYLNRMDESQGSADRHRRRRRPLRPAAGHHRRRRDRSAATPKASTLRDKLEAAGNDVAYQNWNGVTHEFFGMAAVVPDAKAAQDFAGERLRAALATE